ncbi:MAG: glycosyltransferase [Pseudomonadota bacterium]
MLATLQRLQRATGRLCKQPAFLYETGEDFLERYVLSGWPEYRLWLCRNRFFTKQGLRDLHREAQRFRAKPLISVIMPVYNPDPAEFQQAIESLLWQAYPHWELCIADDRSTNRDYLRVLGRLRDRRIKVYLNRRHAGIAGTSQHALERASGDYIALMDQDDELSPDALFAFVRALQHQEIDYFYSDRDMIAPNGGRTMHFMKPGWSPEYLLSFNYVCHLEIYRKSLVAAVGGFRDGYEGSQDYDLVLRATEKSQKIYHHPMVLYNWRQSRNSVATNLEAKGYAFESGVRAVMDTAKRRALPVKNVVENRELWRGHYRLIWDETVLTDRKITFVAIGETSEDTGRVTGLLKKIAGPFKNSEFLSARPGGAELQDQIKGLHPDGRVFFCDGTVSEVVTPALVDMVGYLAIQGVSVVGCKFSARNNTLCNAGLAVTESGRLLLAYRGNPVAEQGYGAVAMVPRNVSAVSPAFWGTTVDDLRQKGFAGQPGGYYSAALHYFKETLKTGGRLVCVPYMCLEVDSAPRAYAEELKTFLKEWQEEGLQDRYYNPNLTDISADFALKL